MELRVQPLAQQGEMVIAVNLLRDLFEIRSRDGKEWVLAPRVSLDYERVLG